jgi:CBS domain-containing protein
MDPDGSLVPAASAITDPVETISPLATADEALRRLRDTGAARLLVCRVPGRQPEGVVSELDLVRLATPA